MSDHYINDDLYSTIHKLMPIVCVDCVLYNKNGMVVLLKRDREPMCGKWWFPGGRVLRGEKLIDAAKRIVKKEVGVEIDNVSYLGYDETMFDSDPFDHGGGTHTINFLFSAIISSGNIELDEFHSDLLLVNPLRVDSDDCFDDYIEKFLILSLKNKQIE